MPAAAPSLALIGAGRMGTALARGWLKAKAKRQIVIVEPKPSEEVQGWASEGRILLNPPAQAATTMVLAVKPQQFAAISGAARDYLGPKSLVVSIMAGVRIAQLSRRLDTSRIVRSMPNTPGSIGKGITVFAAAPGLAAADLKAAEALLAPLGEVHGPVDESLMSAVTALSGSGPAYLFLLAEVMAEAGEAEGLPRAPPSNSPAAPSKAPQRSWPPAGKILKPCAARSLPPAAPPRRPLTSSWTRVGCRGS